MGICNVPVAAQICSAGGAAAGAVGHAVAGGVLQAVAKAMEQAEVSMLKFLSTAWTQVPTPAVGNSSPGVAFIQGSVVEVTIIVATAFLIVAAGHMIWTRRTEPMREAFAGVLRLVVVSTAGLATFALLTTIGDQFSTWIIDQSTQGGFAHVSVLGSLAFFESGSTGLLLILSLLAIIGFFIQIGLLLLRSALLIVLAGVWPLSAAASMTPSGNAWFKKITGWLVAFVLYKPAAAIVYATAFRLMSHPGSDQGLATIEGVILILVALITLPALLRLVVPLVSQVSGVSTGAMVGAVAGVATGAVALAGFGGTGATASGAGIARSSGGGGVSGPGPRGALGPGGPSGGAAPGGTSPGSGGGGAAPHGGAGGPGNGGGPSGGSPGAQVPGSSVPEEASGGAPSPAGPTGAGEGRGGAPTTPAGPGRTVARPFVTTLGGAGAAGVRAVTGATEHAMGEGRGQG